MSKREWTLEADDVGIRITAGQMFINETVRVVPASDLAAAEARIAELERELMQSRRGRELVDNKLERCVDDREQSKENANRAWEGVEELKFERDELLAAIERFVKAAESYNWRALDVTTDAGRALVLADDLLAKSRGGGGG
jgi:chromosome segregation ATPase